MCPSLRGMRGRLSSLTGGQPPEFQAVAGLDNWLQGERDADLPRIHPPLPHCAPGRRDGNKWAHSLEDCATYIGMQCLSLSVGRGLPTTVEACAQQLACLRYRLSTLCTIPSLLEWCPYMGGCACA